MFRGFNMFSEKKSRSSSKKTKTMARWFYAAGVILIVMVGTVAVMVNSYLSSTSLKKEICDRISLETGLTIDFRRLSADLVPRPALVVEGVVLQREEKVLGGIAEIQIAPKLLPLLTGNVQLSRVQLLQPDISLDLPQANSTVKVKQLPDWNELVYLFAHIFGGTSEVIADITVELQRAKINIKRKQQPLVSFSGLHLSLCLSVDNKHAASAILHGRSDKVEFWQNGQKLEITQLAIDGGLILDEDELQLVFERLELGEQGVVLRGAVVQQLDRAEISVRLSGKNIDVEATRRLVLNVAGKSEIVNEIFSYLRGGTVEEITFQSQAEVPAGLGGLDNFRLDGKLSSGAVSIPPLDLDLQDVDGEVTINGGVLQGRNLKARIEDAHGREGALQVGLGSKNDVFNLELLIETDLSPGSKHLVTKIVDNEAFREEARRIANLQGNSRGKLTIGDTLKDLAVEVEIYELNFTADYDRLPVRIDVKKGQASIAENRIRLNNMQGNIGKSSFNDLAADIDYYDGLSLDITSGPLSFDMAELYPWLASFPLLSDDLHDFSTIIGTVDLPALHFKWDIDEPKQWEIDTRGAFTNVLLGSPQWKEDLQLVQGEVLLNGKKLHFKGLELVSGVSRITASGTLLDYRKGIFPYEADLDGQLDKEALSWLWQSLQIPEILFLHAPLDLSKVKITQDKRRRTMASGTFSSGKGVGFFLDLEHHNKLITIKKLKVQDQYSTAEIGLRYGPDIFALDFNGNLQPKTLKTLFKTKKFERSMLQGSISLSRSSSNETKGVAKGHLKGKNIVIPISSGNNLDIEEIDLIGEGAKVMAVLSALSWHKYRWTPVQASFDLNKKDPQLKMIEAKLCGVNSPGVITFFDNSVAMSFELKDKDLDVDTSVSCLFPGRTKMSGTFEIDSSIETSGTGDELLKKLHGPIRLVLKDGMIERGRTIASILEVLNVTEIFRGKLPDFTSKGFAYSTISMEGEFSDGKLAIDSLIMDGKTLEIIGQGEIDMLAKSIDMELMAAPFKTVDSIIKMLPGVNYLFGGSLIAIPMSVKGDLDDPVVQAISADSISSGLGRLWKRTTSSPSKLLDLLTPE